MKAQMIALALLLGAGLNAQTKDSTPEKVKSAFKNEFPNTKVSWAAEGKLYEAEFKWNGIETSATYDSSGHRTALETEIKTTALPALAVAYMSRNYPSQKITEAAKITNDKNVVTYEAEIKKDGKAQDILFDEKGNFIR